MLTVHHLGVSQSERIVWLCEELGIEYELKRYDRDPQTHLAPAAYKALHPLGTAPVITDGSLVMSESGAIAEYIIGRYGNRIGGAQFAIDGQTYKLAANNGPNSLHGGLKGFDKVVWAGETFEKDGDVGVIFTHTSPDGDEGFPGALSVKVTYTLTKANELAIDYEATTDKPTVVNLTQHAYFNLAGDGSGDVLGHELYVNADHFSAVDKDLIPLGAPVSVEGTPFDFRTSTPIGARIAADNEQLRLGNGYDHNFVLNRQGPGMKLAARVIGKDTPVSSLNHLAWYDKKAGSASADGADAPYPFDYDPVAAFGKIFGVGNAGNKEEAAALAKRLLRQRKSMLDFLTADIERANQGLAASEKAKLEQMHLHGKIAELQGMLETVVPVATEAAAGAPGTTGEAAPPRGEK